MFYNESYSDYCKRLLTQKRKEFGEDRIQSGIESIDTLYKSVTYKSPFTIVDQSGLEKVASGLSDKADLRKVEKILRLASKIITDNSDTYKRGDLILDRKNEEFGIVIGKKPKDMDKFGKMTKQSDTYLLLTVSKNPDNKDGAKFRIRYVQGNYLQLIEEHKIDTIPIKEIKKFCRQDCKMECSESCKFYQYKPKPIRNFEEEVFGKEENDEIERRKQDDRSDSC